MNYSSLLSVRIIACKFGRTYAFRLREHLGSINVYFVGRINLQFLLSFKTGYDVAFTPVHIKQ